MKLLKKNLLTVFTVNSNNKAVAQVVQVVATESQNALAAVANLKLQSADTEIPGFYGPGIIFYNDRRFATALAALIPSSADETIPPEYPAPSPQG